MSNSSQNTRVEGPVLWEELHAYYSLMFFIAYTFKGQVHVFARQVKILSDKCNIEILLSPAYINQK